MKDLGVLHKICMCISMYIDDSTKEDYMRKFGQVLPFSLSQFLTNNKWYLNTDNNYFHIKHSGHPGSLHSLL